MAPSEGAPSEGDALLDSERRSGRNSQGVLHLKNRVVRMPTNQLTFDYKQLLPQWAYVPAIAVLADSPEFRDAPLPMGLCVGPAVPLARLAGVITLLVKLWLAALAHMTAECHGNSVELPIWVRAMVLPISLAFLCVELECLRHALVPYAQVTGQFFFMSCKVGFGWWLLISAAQSSLNTWDKCNDSVFAGTTLFAMESCHNKELDDFWNTTLLSSVGSYGNCVLYVWAFSMLQVIYPLFTSMPHCTDHVDYCIGSRDAVGAPLKLQYKDMLGIETNLGNALYLLASGQGFQLLNSHNPWYPRSKAQLTSEQDFKSERDFDADKSLSYVLGSLRRCFTRVCLKTLLENALQLHLQVILLSFARMQNENWLVPLVSVVVNVIVIVNHVHDVKDTLGFATEVHNLVGSYPHLDDGVARKQWYAWRLEFILMTSCVLLSVIVAFVLVRVWFTFTCSNAVWELGSGCINDDSSGH